MRRTRVLLAILAAGASLAFASPGVELFDGTVTSVAGEDDTPAATPDSLVHAWIAALGGMERYRNLRSARFTLTTEIYDAESGRLKRTRPRYVTIARLPSGEASRIERWEGDDFIQQGFDGDQRLWASRNGALLPDTAKDFRETLYVARDVFYWFSLPYKLLDPGVYLVDRGEREDRRVVAVQFGEDVGEHQDTWMYHFEERRVWPVEVNYIEEGKTNVNRIRWEVIREAGGYYYPERRVHFDDEGRVTKVLRYSDVEINPEVDPGIFLRP